MQVSVGYSDYPDSAAAGKEAARMAIAKSNREDPCSLVLLFCTARHNQQLLRKAVSSVVGESKEIFGGGAAGVITNDYFGYAGDQVCVGCIWLEESSCTVLCEGGMSQSETETGKRLGRGLLEAGISRESPLILLYDAIDRSDDGGVRLLLATWLLEGIEQGMGFMPEIMGAGLQGDHSCTATMQYTGTGIEGHSAIALSFSDDIHVDSIIMHGCRPASPYYKVTKSDGPVILEINNRPALEFMNEVLDGAIAPEEYPFFLLFGLNHGERWGEYDESNYASRLCMGIDKERGGIVMFEPDMVEGMEFQIMFRSLDLGYMKPKIEKVFDQLQGREPIFALYIDCAGRCAGYGGVDIEDAYVIQKAVGKKVPLLGIYTGAEIAPMGGRSRGLDLTGVFCLFSKENLQEKAGKKTGNKAVWEGVLSGGCENVPVEAALRLCEKNAAKVLALDSKSIAIRHELEQKRRGFSLLAELAVSLREGAVDEDAFFYITQRINSALNMQKTAVLLPNEKGGFSPYVLQGYSVEEKAALSGQIIQLPEELLDPEEPVLITAADSEKRFAELRRVLRLPYFISSPVVVRNVGSEVAAVIITGRMIESVPFLSRLGRSDVETVQAISALLASILVYQKLDDANRQAQSDVLTGLFNRKALEFNVEHRLQTELSAKKKFAFIIIDCDYFKVINDSYGHMEGDTVLNALARFLEKSFRADDCVARIGGDEFAVFCSISDSEGEDQFFRRLAHIVGTWSKSVFTVNEGTTFNSTMSVGISMAPRDGHSYEELFQHADVALYRSKELGRNQYTVYDRATMSEISGHK